MQVDHERQRDLVGLARHAGDDRARAEASRALAVPSDSSPGRVSCSPRSQHDRTTSCGGRAAAAAGRSPSAVRRPARGSRTAGCRPRAGRAPRRGPPRAPASAARVASRCPRRRAAPVAPPAAGTGPRRPRPPRRRGRSPVRRPATVGASGATAAAPTGRHQLVAETATVTGRPRVAGSAAHGTVSRPPVGTTTRSRSPTRARTRVEHEGAERGRVARAPPARRRERLRAGRRPRTSRSARSRDVASCATAERAERDQPCARSG